MYSRNTGGLTKALLLAKAVARHENGFGGSVTRLLATVAQHPTLTKLGLRMVDAEQTMEDDVFREPVVNTDDRFIRGRREIQLPRAAKKESRSRLRLPAFAATGKIVARI